MGLLPDDFVLMPVDEDETYVNHVYLVLVVWMSVVILAGIFLVILAL